MSTEDSKETIGEELFIEELGEVHGGALLIPSRFMTLARGLGEEGVPLRLPVKPKPKPPHVFTTLALGEEGTSVPHTILPMSDD